MGYEQTPVDTSDPGVIIHAIESVNEAPKLRSDYGLKTLWRLYGAPGYAMLRCDLDDRQTLDLYFGWFCCRVAELLGMSDPDALVLVAHTDDGEGRQILTLKPSIVAALVPAKRGRKASG
ncbi:hypothetical protein [Methylobacterium segetis]|uniref:hypothetical protein n=1 Tax=Methylobacterium segetis TaxID=2488750 RepID=UPI001044AF4A|nr:hypothetical protein [Methylobacterium segetis]